MNLNSNHVRVGVLQLSSAGDKERNFKKYCSQIKSLAQKGAQIICLQELFLTDYFCQTQNVDLFDLAEPIPGPTTKLFQELAKELEVVLVLSLFEKRTSGLYHNTVAVLDADGSYLGMYRKMHIPDDPNYLEKFYFTPGDLGFKSFQTRFAKLGVVICWDQWYPEAARLTALSGAQIIVAPTAIGWLAADKKLLGTKQYNAWKNVQVGHSIANEVFWVAPNRVGQEANIEFWGGSFVVDPFGEVLWQGSHTGEETEIITCDLNMIKECRHGWPFFRDRRIDAYQNITKRFVDS